LKKKLKNGIYKYIYEKIMRINKLTVKIFFSEWTRTITSIYRGFMGFDDYL